MTPWISGAREVRSVTWEVRCAVFRTEAVPESGTSRLLVLLEDLVVGEYTLEGLVRHAPVLVDRDHDRVVDRIYVGTEGGAVLRLQWDVEGATGLGVFEADRIFQSSGRSVLKPPRPIRVDRSQELAVIVALDRPADVAETSPPGSQRLVVVTDGGQQGREPVVLNELERLSWGQWSERNLLTDPPAGRSAGWWLELEGDESILDLDVFGKGLLVVRTVDAGADDGSAEGESGDATSCAASRRIGFHRILLPNGAGLGGERRTLWLEGCPGRPFWISPRRALEDLPGEALEDAVLRSGVLRFRAMASERCSFGSFSHFIVSQLEGEGLVALAEMPICVRQRDWNPALAR